MGKECPLKLYSKEPEQFGECSEEECEWWIHRDHRPYHVDQGGGFCAVRAIPECLQGIAGTAHASTRYEL